MLNGISLTKKFLSRFTWGIVVCILLVVALVYPITEIILIDLALYGLPSAFAWAAFEYYFLGIRE